MNVKPLYPLDHPGVTHPAEEKKVQMYGLDDDAREDFITHNQDQKQKTMDDEYQKKIKKRYKKKRLLDIL